MKGNFTKRMMTLIMMSALTVGMSGMPTMAMEANQFSDVESGSEAFEYVEDVFDAGIMEGMEDSDEFGVEENVTRGDIVSYFYKMMNSPVSEEGTLSFSDVADTDIENAVMWAESVGLFDGLREDFFTDSMFEADKEVTREDLIVMVYNLAKGELEIDVTENTVENLDEYEDGADVADEFAEATAWVLTNDVVSLKDGKIAMAEVAERGDAAQAISRLMGMTDVEVAGEGSVAIESAAEKADEESDATKTESDVEETEVETETEAPAANNQQNQSTQKPVQQHTHNWVANMVTVDVPEQGHTEQQLVKEAWTETVNHPEEGHTESQLVKEAWTETVEHAEEGHYEEKKVVDKEAVYETVHHEAEGYYEEKKVVDQEAVYEEVLVSPEEGHWEQELVKDAWTETINHPEEFHYEQVKVVDQEAWDEPIYAYKVVCNFCNGDLTKLDANGRMNHVVNHFESGECTNIPGWSDTSEQVIIGYTHHDEVFHYEDKKVVDKEAWTETINHPAEYKDVWVVDKEAVYEQQLVSPEISHIEKVWVETKPAWDEQVLVSPEESHIEKVWVVDKEAWTETTEHPAEYKDVYVVDKEAWVETIEHPAEYQDVYVVDVPATTTKVQNGYICTGCWQVTGGIVGKG